MEGRSCLGILLWISPLEDLDVDVDVDGTEVALRGDIPVREFLKDFESTDGIVRSSLVL